MLDWIHVTGEKKLKPVNSDENFSLLIQAYGFNIYHNVILKDIVCEYQNSIHQYDAIIGKIDSIMNVNNFPARNVNTRVISYAHDKYKNPWADWVLSKKWDGASRIEDFYTTVEVKPEHENIKRLYLRKWIMQMLHISCFNNDIKAKQARAVLVFQGRDEGKQKTAWLHNLAPQHFQNYVVTGKQGTINNDMNIKDIISCVMCELGELDGMFKKSDISALKNFLSRFEDSLNRKYEKSKAKLKLNIRNLIARIEVNYIYKI
jgi:putative DNA primase/helicase